MSWRLKAVLLLLMSCLSAYAQEEQIVFSAPGGFYEHSFPLTLQCRQGNHIRYTVNGDTPTSNSTLYSHPLWLDTSLYSNSNIYTIVNSLTSNFFLPDDIQRAIVIRAAEFNENDSCVGLVTTNSYFIRELGCDFHGLPVLSIATDSVSLFDFETGIFIPGSHFDPSDSTHTGNYYEKGREWERLCNMEFYEPDNEGINQLCGLRTHGGKSRRFQQKGMKLYARKEYGTKRFCHPFFESLPMASFKRLNLHPFRCSHWLQTGGQDYLSQTVASGLDMETLAVRQTVVFINGEYWGIYTLEESPDERYLEDHYDVDLDQLNMIKYWEVEQYGDISEWNDFFQWMHFDADLQQAGDSLRAFTQLDIDSFIDYILFETFSANLDWPQNNVLLWQAANGAPFRFIFFDGDGCFTRWEHASLNNALHQGGNSYILSRLMTNGYFKQRLWNRYQELRQSLFTQEAIAPIVAHYRALVKDQVVEQSERFHFPESLMRWEEDLDKVNDFLLRRMSVYEQELMTLLSTASFDDTVFSCYPNPSEGAFVILFHSDYPVQLPIEIFDIMGRKVFTTTTSFHAGTNTARLHPQIPSGLYDVRLGTFSTKMIIQK